MLATVMFVDMVDFDPKSLSFGDKAWHESAGSISCAVLGRQNHAGARARHQEAQATDCWQRSTGRHARCDVGFASGKAVAEMNLGH